MKILYGVTGEGMGHATRSKVVITHLIEQGHEVKIVVSGRAHAFLKRFFPDVEEIVGLTMIYEENAVKRGRTFRNFLKELPLWGGWAENFETMTRLSESYMPDAVISDFESFAYLYGQKHDVPVLSIDNMQVLNRCVLDVEVPDEDKTDYRIARGIVKAKLPGCYHYLITTFFYPPIRKPRTSLYPPILRDDVLAAKAKATRGEHVLVYQTSESYTQLVPTLQKLGGRFIVYGLGRDETLGNVRLKPFSETGFVDDLASSRAVIAGGGFSLMSEAVYLGKPMLSVPIKRQFEQILNALELEKLGYGKFARELSPEVMGAFLERADEYAKNVARHHQDGNRALCAAVDAQLGRITAGKPAEADDE
jgi:uncharacterized protein (TIGR00661 family)